MSIILLFGLLSLSLQQGNVRGISLTAIAFEGYIAKYEWDGKKLDSPGKTKVLEEIINNSEVKVALDHVKVKDDEFQLFFKVPRLRWIGMRSIGANRIEKMLNGVAPNNKTHKVLLKINHMAFMTNRIYFDLSIVIKYRPENAEMLKPDSGKSDKFAATLDKEVTQLFRKFVRPDAIISVKTKSFTRPRGIFNHAMTARAYMTVDRDKLTTGNVLFPLAPEMWFKDQIFTQLDKSPHIFISSIGVRGLEIKDPIEPFTIPLRGYLYNADGPILFKESGRDRTREMFGDNIVDAIRGSPLRSCSPRVKSFDVYPVLWVWTVGQAIVRFNPERLEKLDPLFATSERTVLVVDIMNKMLSNISKPIVRNFFTYEL